eukprot:snap_masked-scaffold_19-processed-gene-1.23-mRNA-1 protein AED:1.00 eAED:1.00 QI:0/-1/0/0/-1/1/1/0/365
MRVLFLLIGNIFHPPKEIKRSFFYKKNVLDSFFSSELFLQQTLFRSLAAEDLLTQDEDAKVEEFFASKANKKPLKLVFEYLDVDSSFLSVLLTPRVLEIYIQHCCLDFISFPKKYNGRLYFNAFFFLLTNNRAVFDKISFHFLLKLIFFYIKLPNYENFSSYPLFLLINLLSSNFVDRQTIEFFKDIIVEEVVWRSNSVDKDSLALCFETISLLKEEKVCLKLIKQGFEFIPLDEDADSVDLYIYCWMNLCMIYPRIFLEEFQRILKVMYDNIGRQSCLLFLVLFLTAIGQEHWISMKEEVLTYFLRCIFDFEMLQSVSVAKKPIYSCLKKLVLEVYKPSELDSLFEKISAETNYDLKKNFDKIY